MLEVYQAQSLEEILKFLETNHRHLDQMALKGEFDARELPKFSESKSKTVRGQVLYSYDASRMLVSELDGYSEKFLIVSRPDMDKRCLT